MGDNSMIEIVCYMGGTCGDLIAAVIDCRGSQFQGKKIKHVDVRQRLKKPHLFATSEEKDEYLKQVETDTSYQSIPSHDLAYHINRKHSFIGITCDDIDVALQAAKRFKDFHRPQVWEEMQTACGAKSLEEYAQMMIDFSNLVRQHTKKTVKLESIMSGSVLQELETILGRSIEKSERNLYTNWLALQAN